MAKGKMLIVDDDEEMCEELKAVLMGEGYHPDVVFEGGEAQKAVKENNYDIVILDLKLPGVSGYEVLKSLKAQDPLIKVVVLTGNPVARQFLNNGAEDPVKETGLNPVFPEDPSNWILALADGVLNKPCDIGELLLMLKRWSALERME